MGEETAERGGKFSDTRRKRPHEFCGHPLEREENIHKRRVRHRKSVRWARKQRGGEDFVDTHHASIRAGVLRHPSNLQTPIEIRLGPSGKWEEILRRLLCSRVRSGRPLGANHLSQPSWAVLCAGIGRSLWKGALRRNSIETAGPSGLRKASGSPQTPIERTNPHRNPFRTLRKIGGDPSPPPLLPRESGRPLGANEPSQPSRAVLFAGLSGSRWKGALRRNSIETAGLSELQKVIDW